MDYYILAVNPRSAYTKLAVYKNEELLFDDKIEHPQDEVDYFEDFYEQSPFRKMVIMNSLEEHKFDPALLSCVVSRGGRLPHVEVGGYYADDTMINYIKNLIPEPTSANLGCTIAKEIGDELNIPAYIYDAPSACSLPEEELIVGMPEIENTAYCHVLNSRAAAVKFAEDSGRTYDQVNVIVASLGKGVSVSAHIGGKIVCVSDGPEGIMSPINSGSVPMLSLVDMCYSGKYSRVQMNKKIIGEGGIKAYLGTSDMKEVMDMAEKGNKKAELLIKAEILHISKAIGSAAAAVKGNIEAILLIGGMTNEEKIVDAIKEHVSFIAPVKVCAPKNECRSLAMGALRILRGSETALEFKID